MGTWEAAAAIGFAALCMVAAAFVDVGPSRRRVRDRDGDGSTADNPEDDAMHANHRDLLARFAAAPGGRSSLAALFPAGVVTARAAMAVACLEDGGYLAQDPPGPVPRGTHRVMVVTDLGRRALAGEPTEFGRNGGPGGSAHGGRSASVPSRAGGGSRRYRGGRTSG